MDRCTLHMSKLYYASCTVHVKQNIFKLHAPTCSNTLPPHPAGHTVSHMQAHLGLDSFAPDAPITCSNALTPL